MDINGYQLSRAWFDFCFENPELINPNHTAIYFFAIEHCNRMGWKAKFGFPTQMAMDAIGIKSYHTYIKNFRDLCEWGFIDVIQQSTNQYSANIISLQSALLKKYKASTKALDKAFIKHASKQSQSTIQSSCESNDSIDKPITNNQLNQEPINNITSEAAIAEVSVWPTFEDFWKLYDKKVGKSKSEGFWKKIDQGGREKIMQHAESYVAATEQKFRKDPERYFKHECWNDEIILKENGKQGINGTGKNSLTAQGTLDRVNSYR